MRNPEGTYVGITNISPGGMPEVYNKGVGGKIPGKIWRIFLGIIFRQIYGAINEKISLRTPERILVGFLAKSINEFENPDFFGVLQEESQ